MFPQNLHMHSTFDDGRDSCEAMLEACLQAGMQSAAVSLHSPLPYANDWAAKETAPFLAEMARLKETFAGRLRVYTGLELDLLSRGRMDLAPFETVIVSAHHLPLEALARYGDVSGEAVPPTVDESPETTARILQSVFHGDADAMAEVYFAEVEKAAAVPEAQICGHFDILTKFNERHPFFDPDSPRYRKAALRALEAMAAAGKVLEINTGAISRDWRTTPYPSQALLQAWRRMGGQVTLASDAHSAETVAQSYEEAEALAHACGFEKLWQFA